MGSGVGARSSGVGARVSGMRAQRAMRGGGDWHREDDRDNEDECEDKGEHNSDRENKSKLMASRMRKTAKVTTMRGCAMGDSNGWVQSVVGKGDGEDGCKDKGDSDYENEHESDSFRCILSLIVLLNNKLVCTVIK